MKSGTLILVEVHGLPDNEVRELTYMATREVGAGELIHVPAPEWAIRVTGRDTLPGFVLGVSTQDIPHEKIRTIRSENTHAPIPAALQAMLDAWAEEARAYEGHAAELLAVAQAEQSKALRIYERMGQVTRAAGIH
jgi:hypothetical protein